MIKMFRVGGKWDSQSGCCNLSGSHSGVSLKEGKGKKNLLSCLFKHLCFWSPHQQRHLSLNTILMKVIYFNGASFQTPVIKACGAFDWEVVETV